MIKTNIAIISDLCEFLKSAKSKLKYRDKPTDFSRARKLPFERVVGFLINLPRKSLSLELDELFSRLDLGVCYCSKSAFSQARYKLKHCFFEDWNKHLRLSYYTDNEDRIKRWKGFILMGLDGSTAHLFEDAEGKIAEHFGKYRGAVTARVMCAYDVLNRISYLGKIAPIKVAENTIAKDWLNDFQADLPILKKILCLYDMKFIGFAFAYEHVAKGLDFVMRAEPDFNFPIHDFMRSDQKDIIIEWRPPQNAIKDLQEKGYKVDKDTFIKVRLLKIPLEDGTIEVLATTLTDQEKYPYEDFKALYFKRWGTETNFDYWKNKAQIENFSGHKVEAIYQDFYASIFTANVHSILLDECESELEQINEKRIFEYETNKNIGVGVLKGRILDLFLKPTQQVIHTMDELHRLFLFHLEPIRPNRKYPRNKRIQHLNGKYVTMTNYRRAI